MFYDGKKRIVKHVDEISEVASILVDLSTSSLDTREVETGHEEATAKDTATVASTRNTIATHKALYISLKAKIQDLERSLSEEELTVSAHAPFACGTLPKTPRQ